MPCTSNHVASASGSTSTVIEPVIELSVSSVAVTVWSPGMPSMTEAGKSFTPASSAVNMYEPGSTAYGSEDVNSTVPTYVVNGLSH